MIHSAKTQWFTSQGRLLRGHVRGLRRSVGPGSRASLAGGLRWWCRWRSVMGQINGFYGRIHGFRFRRTSFCCSHCQSSQGLKIVVWKTSIFGQSSPLHRLYIYIYMYVCRYRGTWVCTHTIYIYTTWKLLTVRVIMWFSSNVKNLQLGMV